MNIYNQSSLHCTANSNIEANGSMECEEVYENVAEIKRDSEDKGKNGGLCLSGIKTPLARAAGLIFAASNCKLSEAISDGHAYWETSGSTYMETLDCVYQSSRNHFGDTITTEMGLCNPKKDIILTSTNGGGKISVDISKCIGSLQVHKGRTTINTTKLFIYDNSTQEEITKLISGVVDRGNRSGCSDNTCTIVTCVLAVLLFIATATSIFLFIRSSKCRRNNNTGEDRNNINRYSPAMNGHRAQHIELGMMR